MLVNRLCLGFFCSAGYFLTLIGTTGRTGAVRQLGSLAIWAYREGGRSQKIMGAPHVFTGFRRLFLGYCHGGFSFMAKGLV